MLNALWTTRSTLGWRNFAHAFLHRLLANSPQLLNVSGAISNGDEIVDLTQGSSVFVASDVCLLGYECSESLSLRHDAAGFRGYETSRDRRRHS